MEFIEKNRSNTGRTLHAGDSRYHGAQHYLDSRWTCIKVHGQAESKSTHSKAHMEDEGVAASVEGDKEAEAFLDSRRLLQPHSMADTFVAVLAITNPGVKLPGTSTIARWFTDLYGAPSLEFGHTTLFPSKTDACSTCSEDILELQKLERSLARHLQHIEDAGSVARQQAPLCVCA